MAWEAVKREGRRITEERLSSSPAGGRKKKKKEEEGGLKWRFLKGSRNAAAKKGTSTLMSLDAKILK